MGAQMNIKNDEAYALASKLAEKTGTSLTQVVLEALRAQHNKSERETKIAQLMEFAGDTAAMMPPETLALDINRQLYDETTGLLK